MRVNYLLMIDKYSFNIIFLMALLSLVHGDIQVELLIQAPIFIQFSNIIINIIKYERILNSLVFLISIIESLESTILNYSDSYTLLFLTNIFHPPVFKY